MIIQKNCKCCGAPFNNKSKCDYCGSYFFNKNELKIIENKDGLFVKSNPNRDNDSLFNKLSTTRKIGVVLCFMCFPFLVLNFLKK